ncbi:unnamed protein product [Arctogadus glacialis]
MLFGTWLYIEKCFYVKKMLCIFVFQPSAAEDAENDIVDTVMGIHTVRQFEEPDDIGVVIEGVKVLKKVTSATMAFIMLFGLIYALDLMNLDGHRLNKKIQQLKIKLFM